MIETLSLNQMKTKKYSVSFQSTFKIVFTQPFCSKTLFIFSRVFISNSQRTSVKSIMNALIKLKQFR